MTNKNNHSIWRRPVWLYSLIAGLPLSFAFAPFNIFPLAILSLFLLVFAWMDAKPNQAFWRGLWFGVGFFGIGASWVFISIHRFGNTNIALAVIFTAIFVITLALFIAVGGLVLSLLFKRDSLLKRLIGFPVAWILCGWLHSWVLTGFPWLLLGYSQIQSPLAGYIPILGNYGVGFIIAFTAAVFSIICSKRFHLKTKIILFIVIGLIWLSGAALQKVNWTQPSGKNIPVTAIQGNIPQGRKWSQQEILNNIKVYWDLTKTHWGSHIIVWPESSIPVPRRYVKGLLMQLSAAAKAHDATLLIGLPVLSPDNENYYNTLQLLGHGQGVYYKRHLVPFGEYLPFGAFLRGIINFFSIPMSNFVPGPVIQKPLQINGNYFAPFICYEIAFPDLLRSWLPQAHFLVTTSDDSWFGHSIASFQHLQIAQFRSLQSGRDQIFATNGGPSALIDAKGNIINAAPFLQKAVLSGKITPMQGSTPWVIIGNLWILVCLFFIALLASWFDHKKYRKVSKED